MLIKLNGNATRASEPTCGRKTLDGMLLNRLSYFGTGESYAPESDYSMEVPQAMSEPCQYESAAIEPSSSSWHISEQLEDTYVACDRQFAEVSDLTIAQAESGQTDLPKWVDQLETQDFSCEPESQSETEASHIQPELNSPFIAPYQEGNPQTSEVFRTERGTIEFVRHESGTYIRPTYNKCGMLVRVDFNGLSLYKKSTESFWQIVDQDEREISRTEIKSVYFERNGDLVSATANGTKVVILTNGSLATK